MLKRGPLPPLSADERRVFPVSKAGRHWRVRGPNAGRNYTRGTVVKDGLTYEEAIALSARLEEALLG
jgi:hypothetical protein